MRGDFFGRPPDEVAPDLLGCVLEHETADGLVAVVLTEVEAYAGAADPASHAYRGQTARNAVMFGPPGHAYVYFTYGMHFCVNVVCGLAGVAAAVLLRAGQVVAGEDVAAVRRAAHRGSGADPRTDLGTAPLAGEPAARAGGKSRGRLAVQELARGPARLCLALAIDRSLDGADLCDPVSPLRLRAPSGSPIPSSAIRSGPRVGVRTGAEVPWRFWVADAPSVSVYRPYMLRRRSYRAGPSRLQNPCQMGRTPDLTRGCASRRVLLARGGRAAGRRVGTPGATK